LIGGDTSDENFPVTLGAYQTHLIGPTDAYVAKLDPTGRELLFCTFIGGSSYNGESVNACTSDLAGHVVIGGMTYSSDWPLTSNAFDNTFGGEFEGFFAMLTPDGSALDYSSYIGGAGGDEVLDATLDSLSGDIYLAGGIQAASQGDFPLTPDAMFRQTVGGAGFISIFDPLRHELLYSTLFPTESGMDPISLQVIGDRRVWLAGQISGGGLPITADAYQREFAGQSDGFMARLDLAAGILEYGSYFGGNDYDWLKLESLDETHVALYGSTSSSDFPVTLGAFDTTRRPWDNLPDGYVSILQLPATLQYSTLLGGSGGDLVTALHRTASGDFLLAGSTSSPDFPVIPTAMDTSNAYWDIFICRMTGDLSHVLYGSFLGGTANDNVGDVIFDNADSLWLSGFTYSRDYPVTPDAFQLQAHSTYSGFLSRVVVGGGLDATIARRVVPQEFSLSAFPNPFNPTTALTFTLPSSSPVTLKVFDVLGRSVYQKDLGRMNAGEHRQMFDASAFSSGVYFARINTPKDSHIQKLLLLR
jgi:hypothetical protein